MTPELDGSLTRTSVAFLAASNVVSEGARSVGGDEELEALDAVLTDAHFYMQERMRSFREPLSSLTVQQAEKLAASRESLSEKLNYAAQVFGFNAHERLEATKHQVND